MNQEAKEKHRKKENGKETKSQVISCVTSKPAFNGKVLNPFAIPL
jgi:hypothetical protein